MELKTCKNCRRLYNHFVGQNLCPVCMTELDEVYREVKSYVYDHPNANIQEVAEEFKISIRTIHEWIREERLEFGSNSAVGLPCQSCGTPIKSGKYCEPCKKNMIDNLSSAYKKESMMETADQKNADTKMRFFR